MLRRPITYTDLDDNEVTDIHYFNLTKTEIAELELGYDNGLEAFVRRIMDAKDQATIVKEFQRLILLAYGQRTEDGKSFIKSDELREAFKQTLAYDALFMELASDADAAAEFFIGIVPKDMRNAVEEAQQQISTTLPPPPASA